MYFRITHLVIDKITKNVLKNLEIFFKVFGSIFILYP